MNTPLSRRRAIGLAVAATMAGLFELSGCARRAVVLHPPTIRYGYDVCAWCGMIIGNPHFAAALAYNHNGYPRDAHFDDIGCMLHWQHAHRRKQVLQAWVKDDATQKWLVAQGAWFIQNAAIHTPMASGIAAGATPIQAASALPSAIRNKCQPMTYRSLRVLEFKKIKSSSAPPNPTHKM